MSRWIVTQLAQTQSNIFGITLDPNCNIYFTANAAIWKLNTKDATPKPELLAHSNEQPLSMFVGIVWSNNKLFICDWILHKIYQYDLNNATLCPLAGFASTKKGGYKDGHLKDAQFRSPWGITADSKGDLYVTDKHHVRKIDLNKQTVETIAGATKEDEIAFEDGEAKSKAKFGFPAGLAMNKETGTMYLCDFSNHCIRKIEGGVVCTIAGHPKKYGFQSGPLSDALFINPLWLVLNDDGTIAVSGGKTIRKVDGKSVSELGLSNQFGDSCIARDEEGNIYAGTKQGLILKLEPAWRTERLLWIGHLKEDPTCPWTRLPKDIIKEIWKVYIRTRTRE